MAIALGYTPIECRVAAFENEFDIYCRRTPRNKYTCTICYGARKVDEGWYDEPQWQACKDCDGGKLIDEANVKLGVQ